MSKPTSAGLDDEADGPEQVTPAAADADRLLGPYDGHTGTSGPVEASRTDNVGVCLHAWGTDLGLTVGGEVEGLAIEAGARLSPEEARDLARQLEEFAEEIEKR